MNPLLTDPLLQTAVVGLTINAVSALAAIYLWNEDRRERYLLFWAVAGLLNALRWSIHYPAETEHFLRIVEGLVIGCVVTLVAMGAYDVLPAKPWRMRRVAWSLAVIFSLYLLAGTLSQRLMELGYALFFITALFITGCLWRGYRATRLSGYALAAASYAAQCVFIAIALPITGRHTGNLVLGPLLLLLVNAGFLLIAYQRAQRRLRDSERKLQKIFDTVPVPIAITQPPRGEIEQVNQHALDLIGLPAAQVVGKTACEIGLIGDPDCALAIHEDLGAGRRVIARELSYQREGIAPRTYAVNGERIELDDGTRHIFALYDLTELRRTQDNLRQRLEQLALSEERFGKAFESAPIAVAVGSMPQGRITRVNSAFEQMSGYHAGELVGRSASDLGIWVRPEEGARHLAALARDGRIREVQVEFRRKDGSIMIGQVSAALISTTDGQGFIFLASDITMRVRGDEAVRQSERKFATVFNTVPDAIAVTRRNDPIYLEVNAAWERRLGHSREEVIGRSVFERRIWVDFADRAKIIEQLDRDGMVANFPSRFVRADGRTTDVLVSAANYELAGSSCILWSSADVSALRQAQRDAQRALERFATIVGHSPDPIAISRLRDHHILTVNDAWIAQLGYAREDVLGRSAAELGIWDASDRKAALAELEAEGRFANRLTTFVRADGSARQALASAARIEVDGEPCAVFLWRDVTELRTAERALAESERRYRSLFQTASDCILIIDRDGRLVDINDHGSRTLEYSREELLGESFTRVLDAHAMSRLYPRPAEILREQRTVRGEQQLRSRSGKLHHVEFVASPLPDSNVLAIVRDVSARKRMEQLLINVGRGVSSEVGEAFFRSLVAHLCSNLGADYAFVGALKLPEKKHVRSLAFVGDGDERPAFKYELAGSPCEHALNRRGTVAFPSRVADTFPRDAGLKRLGAQGYVGTSLNAADGTPLGVLVVMSRRPIENVPLWCSILEIFASRAAAEIERSQTEARVRELNVSLEQKVAARTAELQVANRELESFSYSVSHDLRAPLRAVTGFSSLLLEQGKKGAVRADAVDLLRRIHLGAMRMGMLIDDLLALARIGRSEMHRQDFDLSELAAQVAATLREHQPARAVEFIVQLQVRADGDPGLIRQVLENLLGNAWKFTAHSPAARVEFGATSIDGEAAYFVRDNGVGFDMKHKQRLFKAFQRLHRADEFEGTGIGLSIVQRVVERHGGKVWAESEAGRGSAFYFTLCQTPFP